mmetsp:Transcript_69010/g.108833  ORF Transcript_69010/g.108833 Transcript_69010/m.108833 type:complete len:277 (-) Transcript_69010:899-1729(-)
MSFHQIRVLAHQEFAADRETHEAPDLGDARLLQQGQSISPSTDEDEAGPVLRGFSAQALGLPGLHDPGLIIKTTLILGKVRHFGHQLNITTQGDKGFGQLLGQFPEVHVSAIGHTSEGTPLSVLAALHHQWSPHFHRLRVFGVFHSLEERMILQGIETLLEPCDLLLSMRKGHVRRGADELVWVHQAFLCQIGPVLPAQLEIFVHSDGLVDIYTFASLRRVVGFTEGRMAGTRIVPTIGALLCHFGQALHDDDLPSGFQLLQKQRQGGTHDATSHE